MGVVTATGTVKAEVLQLSKTNGSAPLNPLEVSLGKDDVLLSEVNQLSADKENGSILSGLPLKKSLEADLISSVLSMETSTSEEKPSVNISSSPVAGDADVAVDAEASTEKVEETSVETKASSSSNDDLARGLGILGSKPDAVSNGHDLVVPNGFGTSDPLKRPAVRPYRGPRPDFSKEHQAIHAAELLLKEKQDRQKLITAALQLKQARRAEAFAQLKELRGDLRGCYEDLGNTLKDLEPVQASLDALQEKGRAARSRGRELPCATEEELDRKIAELEYLQMHETRSLNDERKLVKELAKLRSSRDEVRANAVLLSEFSDTQGQREALQARLKAMQIVANIHRSHRDEIKKKVVQYDQKAHELEAAVNELFAERAVAMREHTAAYEALKEAKAALAERRRQFAAGEYVPSSNVRRKTLEEDVNDLLLETETSHSYLLTSASQPQTSSTLGASADATETKGAKKQATKKVSSVGLGEKGKGDTTEVVANGTIKVANEVKLEKKKPAVHDAQENGYGRDEPPPMADSIQASEVASMDRLTDKSQASKMASLEREKPGSNKKPAPAPVIERADMLGGGASALLVTISPSTLGGKEGEDPEVVKERRRQEALEKHREAEERKKRQLEKAEARARARAEKAAEEAKQKKERKSKKKKITDAEVSEGEPVVAAEAGECGVPGPGGSTTSVVKTAAKEEIGVVKKDRSKRIAQTTAQKVKLPKIAKKDWLSRLRAQQHTVALVVMFILIFVMIYLCKTSGGVAEEIL